MGRAMTWREKIEAWDAIANDFAEPKCLASDPSFQPHMVSGKTGTLTIGGMISELHAKGQITKTIALEMLERVKAHGIDREPYTVDGARARVKWCRQEQIEAANA